VRNRDVPYVLGIKTHYDWLKVLSLVTVELVHCLK
jgi:hypothetical protein